MKLFEVTKREALIRALVAVRHDWRAVHVLIPWIWGRVGFGYDAKAGFYTLSQWRDCNMNPASVNVPSGSPKYNSEDHVIPIRKQPGTW